MRHVKRYTKCDIKYFVSLRPIMPVLQSAGMLTLLTVWMAKLIFPAAKAVANEAFNICDTMLSAGAEVTTTFFTADASVR